MSERVVTFGPRSELVGVLAQPDKTPSRPDSPAVLMWNVGVNHRVGPFRIYVDLARELARAGFVSLRFDASGLGDSEVRREAVSDAKRMELDVRDAMDFLSKKHGIHTFILIGFCSSVDAAHRVSTVEPRVVGVVHLEGYAYRTRGFKLRYALRFLSRERWERFVRHRASTYLPGLLAPAGRAPAPEAVYKRDYPAWPDFTRDLETLGARGVKLLFVYFGGDTDYNHRGQFWEMFGSKQIRRSLIDVEYYPRADHTLFGLDVRRDCIATLTRWVSERFGTAAPHASALAMER